MMSVVRDAMAARAPGFAALLSSLRQRTHIDALTRDLSSAAGSVSAAPASPGDVEAGLQAVHQPPNEPAAPADEDRTVAAAAEWQRWSGELGSSSDNLINALTHWVDGLIPYLLVLLGLFVIQHSTSLLQLAWFMSSLVKVNRVIRTAWLSKDCYQALPDLGYQVLSLLACMYITKGWPLLAGLGFNIQAAPHATVVATLVSVAVLDSMARVLVALTKLPLLLGCKMYWAKCSAAGKAGAAGPAVARERMKREAALMSLVDNASTCYRQLLPVPFWFTFLLHGASSNAVLSSCLAGGYVTRKAWELLCTAGTLPAAARKLLSAAMLTYGRPATQEEVVAAGNQCPVCQDSVKTGVRLACGHIFCEECIAEWLERDCTCPMCRKQVRPPNSSPANTLAAVSPLPRLF